MAKGLGKVANALAIGIGAGMEGYGKGTMQLLLEQRQEALNEIKERRAAQRDVEERDWRTEESEKTRDFQRERDETSMAWEKEKFGLQEESEERRTNRSLSAQMQLAKMRGGGGGGAAEKLPADLQKVEYLADLIRQEEGAEKVTSAHKRQAFERLNQERAASVRSGDDRTAAMKEAEALADMRAQAEGRERTPADVQSAFEELKGLGEKQGKGSGTDPFRYAKALQDEIASIDPYGQQSMAGKSSEVERQARANLSKLGINPPGGGQTEAPRGQGSSGTWGDTASTPTQVQPASEPEITSPPGSGTEAEPYVAASDNDIMWFKENAPSGAFITYNGKVYKKP